MQNADCRIRKGEKSLVFYSEIRIPYLPKRPRRQGSPRKRDFAKLNLHPAIFKQPEKNGFFRRLIANKKCPHPILR